MPERKFYLDAVEAEEWNVTVEGTRAKIMHHAMDENGETKSKKNETKTFSSAAELTAWLTAEISQKVSDGFREMDAEGNYVKSPEAGKAKKVKVSAMIGKVLAALQDQQARPIPAPYAKVLKGSLPAEAHAFLDAVAKKQFSSLTIGDFVMRDTDHTIKMPKNGDGLFPIGQSEGGDIYGIAIGGTGKNAPVFRLMHDEKFLKKKAAGSLESFLKDCVAEAKEQGKDVDI